MLNFWRSQHVCTIFFFVFGSFKIVTFFFFSAKKQLIVVLLIRNHKTALASSRSSIDQPLAAPHQVCPLTKICHYAFVSTAALSSVIAWIWKKKILPECQRCDSDIRLSLDICEIVIESSVFTHSFHMLIDWFFYLVPWHISLQTSSQLVFSCSCFIP